MLHFSFGGAARHVLIRPLGHRGRTTMLCSAEVYFVLNLKALRFFCLNAVRFVRCLRNSLRQLCCGSCILYWPPALHMHFRYGTVNSTLPWLVDVVMFFSRTRSWWSSCISCLCPGDFRVSAYCWVAMCSGVGTCSSYECSDPKHGLKLWRTLVWFSSQSLLLFWIWLCGCRFYISVFNSTERVILCSVLPWKVNDLHKGVNQEPD